MRIERIALKGFLSHADTDWSPDGARLATLVGANGAGKSSLLDGVLYALYDDARGRTDDLVQLGATDMSATVEFAYAGARYRVTRGRTTRAGGKSFLELAVADSSDGVESWLPLTADSIRETQAAIEELLRMDAATFRTAAFLVQGKANAFAEATAAERKRILGTVLGLDVYERAEARTRELARDLAARSATDRAQAARLDERLAGRPAAELALRDASAAVEAAEAEQRAIEAKIAEHDADLARLAELRAAAAAAGEDLRRLTGEVDEQARRWKTTEQSRQATSSRLERAEATLLQATRVREAGRKLPRLRERLSEAESIDATYTAAQANLSKLRDQLAGQEADHRVAAARRTAQRRQLADRVAQLEASVAALEPVTCPECGARFPADPAGLAQRLSAAREDLAAAPPELDEPVPLAQLRAAAQAAEQTLPERPDPHLTAKLRQEVIDTAALAAGQGAVDEAKAIAAEAREELDRLAEEAEQIQRAGKAARDALEKARAKAVLVDDLAREIAAAEEEKRRLWGERRRIAGLRDEAIAARAEEEAHLRGLDELAEERDLLSSQLAREALEEQLLGRLVTAFGVNGIPARIVESVLPELGRYANELLGQLRPGMALEIRAQRARKSGTGVVEALDLVVRDDAGERPLSLFSGGERMSVSLALAVGLSRLVARRAGTAIRSLVIDEPDGLDADARRAFGQALRVLAHAGELERVVLVSHHPDLADVGDAVYEVTRRNGRGSVVERVA